MSCERCENPSAYEALFFSTLRVLLCRTCRRRAELWADARLYMAYTVVCEADAYADALGKYLRSGSAGGVYSVISEYIKAKRACLDARRKAVSEIVGWLADGRQGGIPCPDSSKP